MFLRQSRTPRRADKTQARRQNPCLHHRTQRTELVDPPGCSAWAPGASTDLTPLHAIFAGWYSHHHEVFEPAAQELRQQSEAGEINRSQYQERRKELPWSNHQDEILDALRLPERANLFGKLPPEIHDADNDPWVEVNLQYVVVQVDNGGSPEYLTPTKLRFALAREKVSFEVPRKGTATMTVAEFEALAKRDRIDAFFFGSDRDPGSGEKAAAFSEKASTALEDGDMTAAIAAIEQKTRAELHEWMELDRLPDRLSALVELGIVSPKAIETLISSVKPTERSDDLLSILDRDVARLLQTYIHHPHEFSPSDLQRLEPGKADRVRAIIFDDPRGFLQIQEDREARLMWRNTPNLWFEKYMVPLEE